MTIGSGQCCLDTLGTEAVITGSSNSSRKAIEWDFSLGKTNAMKDWDKFYDEFFNLPRMSLRSGWGIIRFLNILRCLTSCKKFSGYLWKLLLWTKRQPGFLPQNPVAFLATAYCLLSINAEYWRIIYKKVNFGIWGSRNDYEAWMSHLILCGLEERMAFVPYSIRAFFSDTLKGNPCKKYSE